MELTVECDDDVEGERWSRLLAAALAAEGVAPGAEAGLSFVTPAAMAELNAAHMGATGPTDVLAFPIDGRDAAGGTSGSGPPGVVGDVVVCPSVAHTNAPGHAGLAADELALLVVHGALHLIGHDHAEGDEREQMQARERALLAELHGPLAADPWAER
ncbi:rRNA maturation RNase YbeY [Iamia sp.]|uniref:rRNA maturation RNase YbeY n=1 Tax=Iamia sp. TaxID=2722710 RepID=UPI002CEB6C3B|nr:rRNA maturation RNase YbeY [Iamia sp.]HXH57914.1 rRNA maturation RNase YbeY [Iamia sp.]